MIDAVLVPLLWTLVNATGILAMFSIVGAGMCRIIGLRQLSGRLLQLAGLFIVISILGPGWIPPIASS